MAFQPHGLIRSLLQQGSYEEAHIANATTDVTSSKETKSMHLLQILLTQNIFNDQNYAVLTQRPPAPNSNKVCDIVVNHFDGANISLRIMCFAKNERTGTSQPFSLKALEARAYDCCQSHLDFYEETGFIYVITCAGTRVRLWKCNRDDSRLTPLWGEHLEGCWEDYRDFGEDDTELAGFFNTMKV